MRRGVTSWLGLFACLLPTAMAWSQSGPGGELPPPLRTADLQAWERKVKPTPEQRVAMDRAFDACVEQWMQLRDGSVRPGQAKLAAAPDDDAARAAWRTTRANAFASMEGMERAMFDAMRSAGLDDGQRQVLDDLAAARARRRARTAIVGVPVNLPAVPKVPDLSKEKLDAIETRRLDWERSATPLIERLAAASLDPQGADRRRELSRKVRLGERAAVRDIAALLPPGFAEKYLTRFRRQCMPSELAYGGPFASSPSDIRTKLDPERHAPALAKVDEWEKRRAELEEAMLDALLAEQVDDDAVRALSERAEELNRASAAAVAESAGMPELAQPSDRSITMMLGAENGLDLEELADEGGVAIFATGDTMGGDMPVQGVVMMRSDAAPIEGGGVAAVSVQVVATSDAPIEAGALSDERLQAAVEHGKAVAEAMTAGAATTMDGQQVEAGADITMPGITIARSLRPLSRQSIELLRTRLQVPEEERAKWDMLAEDLLEKLSAWIQQSGERPMGFALPGPGESPEAFVKRGRARQAELARIEEAWFDDLKSGMKLPDVARVDTERQRRAIERARDGLVGSLPMPELMMSRWLRLDLDKAANGLSPEGTALSTKPLAAWRAQLLQSLVSMQPAIDRAAMAQMGFMQSVTQDDGEGNIRVNSSMQLDEKQAIEVAKAREPVAAACREAEQSQKTSAEAVAAALKGSDAVMFRRAVRRQTHPEAYRSQERVDRAFDRVLQLKDLTPAQLQAVGALGEDYRQRSDRLVELSVERMDRSDRATKDLMEDGPGMPDAAMARRMKDFSSAQRGQSDATYDREELNARALRRLRAALTPEQADAAKVD